MRGELVGHVEPKGLLAAQKLHHALPLDARCPLNRSERFSFGKRFAK